MFDKITGARERLRVLHLGDPSHAADQVLYGAIHDELNELKNRIEELEKRSVPKK